MKQATALLSLLVNLVAPAMAAGPAGTTPACPYTAAELGNALGFTLDPGQGTETPFAGGKMLACRYAGKQKFSVTVSQVQLASRDDALQVAKGLSGTPITGDADAALWVKAMGSAHRLPLSYVRGTTHTEFSVTGIDSNNPVEADAMKKKVLTLRRVP